MTQYQYTAVFEPAPEGGYVVTIPALPGLVTEDDTVGEARNGEGRHSRVYREPRKAR